MTLAAGFFGKIPDRGDFVRNGLPAGFVNALDTWWQIVLSESRALLGEGWVAAWMEAPLWRFALAPGCCGPDAAIGLWVPSVDKAGRLFPLTLAATAPAWEDVAGCAGFLDAAAGIAMQAVEQDVSPAQIAAGVAQALAGPSAGTVPHPGAGAGRWWTDGSPLVAPADRTIPALPDSRQFALMLRDGP